MKCSTNLSKCVLSHAETLTFTHVIHPPVAVKLSRPLQLCINKYTPQKFAILRSQRNPRFSAISTPARKKIAGSQISMSRANFRKFPCHALDYRPQLMRIFLLRMKFLSVKNDKSIATRRVRKEQLIGILIIH